MNITGKITGIKYKVLLADELQKFELEDFDINTSPTACFVNDGKASFAISRWVSPKRTRSYPYERVYNTLSNTKIITVIPIVKDEGAIGDRDFVQWDTVSLMSLLNVYVIFGYYHKAQKTGNKINLQEFDNDYVLNKLKQIKEYHSSALHWNLNELKQNFHSIIDKTISSYMEIEKTTGVKLHGIKGIENFKEKIGEDVSLFMEFSRGKAEKAQGREFVTQQPKENLTTLTKAKITITNYLGGLYYFTVDEIKITTEKIFLIEGKHSVNSLLPSKGDIKDGLLKMILYSNLVETTVDGKDMKCEPLLELTSSKLKGQISCNSTDKKINEFYKENNFAENLKQFVNRLFEEAKTNNFTIKIKQEILERADD